MAEDEFVNHEILHSLARIEQRNATSDERMERIEEQVGHLDEAIRGNGKPGLRTEHASLEERVKAVFSILKWAAGAATTVGTAGVVWLLFR